MLPGAASATTCDDGSVAKIHEAVDIDAPAERVWVVVAEDVKNAPRWSTNLERIEKLDDGPPGRGTRYRYHLDIGGQKVTFDVEQDVFIKPKRCAGRFVKGPLKGTWAYTYTQRKDGSTHLVYDMDFELTGLLRFATGVLGPQYAAGIRQNMGHLKRYVESGKRPKVAKGRR